jgi:hypothetical protein
MILVELGFKVHGGFVTMVTARRKLVKSDCGAGDGNRTHVSIPQGETSKTPAKATY